MTIAITGANGQLGSILCRRFGDACTPLVRPTVDLADPDSIRTALLAIQPNVLINAAAYTAVDKAEEDALRCERVNADAVAVMAEVCQEIDCVLVQISTDYVYEQTSGDTPFLESESPLPPQGVYARTKLAGEGNARRWERHFIIRTCGLYALADAGPIRGRNFVDTMLHLGSERDRLSVVDDQYCTPTFVPHLVDAIESLLSTDAYGLYHITNSGATTWYSFAQEIFRLAELDVQLDTITTAEYGAAAPRPSYSVLSTDKYSQLTGNKMPNWTLGLAEYVKRAIAHSKC